MRNHSKMRHRAAGAQWDGISLSRVRTLVATELLLLLGLLAFVGAAALAEEVLSLTEPLALSPALALVLAAVPALLWLGYFYAQDRHEPAPKRFVFGVTLLGAFVAAPVAHFAVELVLAPRVGSPLRLGVLSPERVVAAIAVVGVVQELCKYAVVRYTTYSSAELDEPIDGILYATAAALGFSTHESYLALGGSHGAVYLSWGAAQTVVAALAHASLGAVVGYALGRAKFAARSATHRGAILVTGIGVAALLNGGHALVGDTVTRTGLALRPWHGLAFTAGFAAAIFLLVSLLMRRLMAATAPAAEPSS